MILTATAANIAAAAERIRAGQVVAFPTETVYGLGADATNARAVAEIFTIKARPRFDPLIVHVRTDWLTDIVTVVPAAAKDLADRFWPGPLTLVLPKRDTIPDIVTAGLPSVAVRVPDHATAAALISQSGCPIAAPSANPFGYVSPTTAQHVAAQIGQHIPLILDDGPCRVGLESTVMSFVHERPTLLRPGAITLEQIEAVIGSVDTAASGPRPMAPGQLPHHYAPRTTLVLVSNPAEIPLESRRGAALLLPQPIADVPGFAHVEVLADHADLAQVAANLFAALRRLDAGAYQRIYAVTVPEHGLGRAIMDRLRRAAARSETQQRD